MNKLKAAHELGKKPYSTENYAVALKYDYKLSQSNILFEDLITRGIITEKGIIEYAGTLIKQKNFNRALEVLNLKSDSNQDLLGSMKMVTTYLQNKDCTEYKIEENSSSTYCFTFDASASADPVLKNLSYTWTFDETEVLEGIRVDYCFPNSGTHSVTLGSYDRLSNIKNRDTTFIVSIRPPLNFDQMLKNNIIKKSIDFEYEENLENGTTLLWHFGNGIFKKGKKADFTFNRPGNYYIEFFLIPEELAQSSLYCNSCQFFVNQSRTQPNKP